MIKTVWKILSLLLSLTTFGVVAVLSVLGSEELQWAVLRAIISFAISWIILSNLGSILSYVLQSPEEETGTAGKKQQQERLNEDG